MFDTMNEQIQKTMKPMTELASINAKTLEQLAEKQASLFTSLVNEGVNFGNNLTQHQDVTSLANAQKGFWENVQQTLVSSGKESYEIITKAQEKTGDVLKTSVQAAQPAPSTAKK